MKIFYKNAISEVTKLGEDIRLFAKPYHLDEETVYHLNLCLEELIGNIILYGFEDTKEHRIELDISYYADPPQVVMRIKDDGIAFNPLRDAPSPPLGSSLAERRQGGLGVYLVKKFMTTILYAREEGYNVLKITKCL